MWGSVKSCLIEAAISRFGLVTAKWLSVPKA